MNLEVINLPKIIDPRGNLTFLEEGVGLPFRIARTFWTFDVSSGETRGGHAYKKQNEVISVISGSADIIIKNKNGQLKKFSLNRPDKGLLIPRGYWRHIENFSSNAVTIHFSDQPYLEEDYIRDFNHYINE